MGHLLPCVCQCRLATLVNLLPQICRGKLRFAPWPYPACQHIVIPSLDSCCNSQLVLLAWCNQVSHARSPQISKMPWEASQPTNNSLRRGAGRMIAQVGPATQVWQQKGSRTVPSNSLWLALSSRPVPGDIPWLAEASSRRRTKNFITCWLLVPKVRVATLRQTHSCPTNLYPVLCPNLRKHLAGVVKLSAQRFRIALPQGQRRPAIYSRCLRTFLR